MEDQVKLIIYENSNLWPHIKIFNRCRTSSYSDSWYHTQTTSCLSLSLINLIKVQILHFNSILSMQFWMLISYTPMLLSNHKIYIVNHVHTSISILKTFTFLWLKEVYISKTKLNIKCLSKFQKHTGQSSATYITWSLQKNELSSVKCLIKHSVKFLTLYVLLY